MRPPKGLKVEEDLAKVKKILVTIFKYHGDVLLTSPVYTTLRSHFPNALIDVMLFKDTAPMLEGHPAITNLIYFDQKTRKASFIKRIWYELSLWRKIRKAKYDIAINMTSGDRGALIAKISKAKIRIGFESFGGMKQKDSFFSTILRITKTPRHIVERNLDVVRALKIHPRQEEKRLTFFIPQASQERVASLLPFSSYILIHPSSRTSFKNWPASHFTDLIRRLREKGYNIVISGGPSQEEAFIITEILAPLQDPTIVNLQGKLSLKELGAIIEKALLLISVDSVPPHIASALQKPVLVLFGPSDDLKWGPWMNPLAETLRFETPCKRCDDEGCGGSWLSDCLQKLTPAMALDKIETMLLKEPLFHQSKLFFELPRKALPKDSEVLS